MEGSKFGSDSLPMIFAGDLCACRKSNPDILVVQPAENRAAKNVPGPLDRAQDPPILLQG